VNSPAGPTADLAAAAPDRVAEAARRAGTHNPLLGFAADPPDAQPASDWQTGKPAAALIDAVGGWLGATERRVAASLVVLGYAARLVGPAVALLVRDEILVDVRPERMTFGYAPDRGFQLAMPEPAGWTGPPASIRRAWGDVVVEAHLRPVVDAVRAEVPVAAGLLWGNVASGLAGALAALVRDRTAPAGNCHAVGRDLLDAGPLRGSGELSVHDGQLRFVRRSCCLFYRLEGGGMCGDCPLPKPPLPKTQL
jgi:ferric iron reductase protein FhuF